MSVCKHAPAVLISNQFKLLESQHQKIIKNTAESNVDDNTFNILWTGYGFDSDTSSLGSILVRNYDIEPTQIAAAPSASPIDTKNAVSEAKIETETDKCKRLFKEIENNPITSEFYSKEAAIKTI